MTRYTVDHTITLCVWTCPVKGCGIVYGIDSEYADALRRKAGGYYCPNGHYLSWAESDADRERRRADKAEKNAAYWREDARREARMAQEARNRERAQKAAKTRLKNRIKNGVCPCCNRHFANLERHIKGQHPEYAEKASVHSTGADS